jgi:hypothetical protein
MVRKVLMARPTSDDLATLIAMADSDETVGLDYRGRFATWVSDAPTLGPTRERLLDDGVSPSWSFRT